VLYLERVTLLGMYDPLVLVRDGAASATLALPDRAAALRAWEESWKAFAGSHDGDEIMRRFFGKRAPRPEYCATSFPIFVVVIGTGQVYKGHDCRSTATDRSRSGGGATKAS
jgi:hypothetical protein